VISGFRREVDKKWALLGYQAASSDNFLPTFRFSIPEGGTDRLSRNVGKKLPLLGSLRNDTEERISFHTNHSKLGNVR
jgi:hypothetical protein